MNLNDIFQCKARHDCYAYQFKEFEDFQKGPNAYSSNCVLETAFDRNIFAEEVLKSNDYQSRVK